MKTTTLALLAASVSFGAPALAQSDQATESAASGFTFEGSSRVRYETLSAPFRAGREGSDQQISWRTRLLGEYNAGRVTVGAELFDARAWLTDEGSVLSSTAINTLDLLQAYVRADIEGGELQAGRFVMSVGSKRLVGENSFRNFPSTFEGVRGSYALSEDLTLEAFYTAPVMRKPGDRASLLDNEQAFDEADWDTRFWAAHLTREGVAPGVDAELYVFGRNKDGGDDRFSFGGRLSGERGAADFDLEAVWQTGETGAGGDVASAFVYADAGYAFGGAWSPRLSGQLVYASGDDDPTDAEDNRYDAFFGLRRGALGQTGVFGPLDLENIVALGARLEVKRGPMSAHVLVQDVSLASDTDRWRRSGLRDVTGGSGDHVGQVIDTRLLWWLQRDVWRLDTGMAVLFKGDFATDAPGAPEDDTPIYSYVMVTRSF